MSPYFSLLLLLLYTFNPVTGGVCDTPAMKEKRYCKLTGDQMNFPEIRFFEGNNAYTKYGVFNGIVNDPNAAQADPTNPTCGAQTNQLFLKWSQIINLPRSDLFEDNKATTSNYNLLNPAASNGLGIAVVGGFDGCVVSLTFDYVGADQVDLYFTRGELDYPQSVASNDYLEGRTAKTFMNSYTAVTQTDYPSPCAPTYLYYNYENSCFYYFIIETDDLMKVCYTKTTDNDRMCLIEWNESTAPTITKLHKANDWTVIAHPVEHKFTGDIPKVFILKQKKSNSIKHRVDLWNPINDDYTIFIGSGDLTDTGGEITIGVIKDYALVIGYKDETPTNKFFSLEDGTPIKIENVAHKLIQASQDKYYRQLLYGYNYDDKGLYLFERASTNQLTLQGTRIESSHFGIGRYYLVLTNIGVVADRDKTDGDATIDYGSLYFDVYDIERYNHIGTFTSEYTGCKMTYPNVNDPVIHGQDCEDANETVGDGCNQYCEVETGWECLGYSKNQLIIKRDVARSAGMDSSILERYVMKEQWRTQVASAVLIARRLEIATNVSINCNQMELLMAQRALISAMEIVSVLFYKIAGFCCTDQVHTPAHQQCDETSPDEYSHMCTNCVIDPVIYSFILQCTNTLLGQFYCDGTDQKAAGKCGDNADCPANLSAQLNGLAIDWHTECNNNDWNQYDGCFRNCELDCERTRLDFEMVRSVDASTEVASIAKKYYNNDNSALIVRLCKGNGAGTSYDHPGSGPRYCFEGIYCNAQCSFYQNIVGQPQILRPTAAMRPYLPSEYNGPWEFKAFGDTINDLVFLVQDSGMRRLRTTDGGTWATMTGAGFQKAIGTGGISATLVGDYYIGAEDASGTLTYLQFDKTTVSSIGTSKHPHPDLRGNPYIYHWSTQNVILARHMDGTTWSMFKVETIDNSGTPQKLKPPVIRMSGYLPFKPVCFPDNWRLAVIRQLNLVHVIKTYINVYEFNPTTNLYTSVYLAEITDTVTSFGRDFNGEYLVYTYTDGSNNMKYAKLKIAGLTLTDNIDNTDNFLIIENAQTKYWIWIGGVDGANNAIKRIEGDVGIAWTITDIHTAEDFWVGQERFVELIGADDDGHFVGFMPFECAQKEKQWYDKFIGICLNFMENKIDPAAPTVASLTVA